MRRVHFVDSSILCCLLKIPNFCENNYEAVMEEFIRIDDTKEGLILPVASILETGNHIAQVDDGRSRRNIALAFSDFILDTANNEAPWTLLESHWTADDLRNYANKFPDYATACMGAGDLSIIVACEEYKLRAPGISIRIWTLDTRLSAYSYEAPEIHRRKRG